MNDFDDLDDVFGPLRSAATDAELAGESSHVDAMVRHHRRQKGPTMFTSRRARVATFVAAGVIGFGGVAAAGPGGPFALTGADDTTTTTEVTTTTSEAPATTSEVTTTTSEVTTTTSEAPEVIVDDGAMVTRTMIEETTDADDASLDDDLGPCFGEPPEDFDNHGEFVSKVARGDVKLPEGIEQRDAAQSSCGKDNDDVEKVEVDDDEVEVKDIDDDGDDDDSDSDDDDSDGDDSDDDRPEKSGKPDKPGKPESAGKQGNGSKKNSDD
jgi:hypothetical protein